MSDGECHYVDPVTRQPCCRRFSQYDTHCRSCGKPKWLYHNRDWRPVVRALIEVIAMHERGRQTERARADEAEARLEEALEAKRDWA